jgi:ferredoxin
MNARILGNAMAVQRQNDQKVISRTRAKAQRPHGSYCKIVSTIPKTSFGQINFRAIVEGVGPQCLGCGQCALRCNITDGER